MIRSEGEWPAYLENELESYRSANRSAKKSINRRRLK